MSKAVMIINGANLNLLGTREVEIYGTASLKQVENLCRKKAESMQWSIDFRQSNAEGSLIDMVQEAQNKCNALIINPAAYAHTSIALRDALLNCSISKIEVHISNTNKREKFRHNSITAAAVDGVIIGCGINGYILALEAIALMQKNS